MRRGGQGLAIAAACVLAAGVAGGAGSAGAVDGKREAPAAGGATGAVPAHGASGVGRAAAGAATVRGGAAGIRPAPSVPACALGRVPKELRDALPRALAAEERRFGGSRRARRTFSAAAAAYVYGMPTVLMRRTVARFPTNRLVGVARLATPESRSIVAPNQDTLYSVSRLDLSAGPMVIDAPATGGRYSVLQLLDAHTNAAGYVGSGSERNRATTVAVVPPGWNGSLPPGVRVVRSQTKLVWLLGRTLIDGPADLPGAREVLAGYALTPLADWLAGARTPPIVLDVFPGQPKVELPRGLAFLDELGAALAADPPPARDRCALRAFARAGIAPGSVPSQTADPVARRALEAAVRAGDRLVDRAVEVTRRDSRRRHNGWWFTAPDTGRFGADYAHRAEVARIGLGANVPREAIYPNTDRDSDGRLLSGRHRYVVSFPRGSLPPVRAFWSLTLYDRDLLFAPNAIDRYAVGDRTAGLRYGPGRSLKIYVQHDPPRGARRANWLPAPRGRFSLYLRLYEPKRAALNGRWRPPTIERARPAATTTAAARSSCFWVGPYATRRGRQFNHAFPDAGATYWTARYRLPAGARLSLDGRFAHARYQSLNSYDAATAAPVDALRDVAIRPARGSVNPFVPGARRDARRREYSVAVSPSSTPPGRRPLNTLYAGVPGQSDQALIYRVYVPDRGRDLSGDAGLPEPRLTLPDGTVLGGQAACAALGSSRNVFDASKLPLPLYLSLRDQPGKPPTFPAQDPPLFGAYYNTGFTLDCIYRGQCEGRPERIGGQYSNRDIHYAGAFVNRGFGEVLVLRGKLPTTPRTLKGDKRMGRGQLRYWSMCQNESLATTAGAGCVYDEQIPLAKGRRYTIVTSRPADRPRNASPRCGVAFIPWPARGDGAGHRDDALLLMRNLLPARGFRRAVQNTRVPGDERRVMGPYLPRGEYTSTRAFERRGCRR
jgi:hypothetical protein